VNTTAQQPTGTAWPEGVVARYLTVGGATVDIIAFEDSPDAFEVACTGCANDLPYASIGEARRWSQGHAEWCRAMPKPEAAR
jgi:hypothetical protein